MLSLRVIAAKAPIKKGPSKKPKSKKKRVPAHKKVKYTIDEETMDVIVVPEDWPLKLHNY